MLFFLVFVVYLCALNGNNGIEHVKKKNVTLYK